MNKKAMDLQMNWIFSIIAGFLILMLFLYFISNATKTNQAKVDITTFADLDSIFSSLRTASIDAKIQVSSPLEITCRIGGGGSAVFSEIKLAEVSKSIAKTVIFAPASLVGSIAIKSQQINEPFLLDTALYMTSDRTKYVFLDSDADRDDADFEHIKSLMPQHAVLERAGSASEITSGGFEQVVIISFNHGTILFVTKDYPQNGERLEPALSMVKLSFLDIDSENNKVYFAKSDSVGLLSTYDTGTPSTEYQSDQDLLGIITTLNADLFECNKKKLELVKAITSSVLEKRRAEISTELGTGDCKRILDGVKFSDSYADLQNKNRILESQSCPLLY